MDTQYRWNVSEVFATGYNSKDYCLRESSLLRDDRRDTIGELQASSVNSMA